MRAHPTQNTLKYANRARNIKNRAELNEIEIGWDDVDHLQALVVKLRGELALFRTGNGPVSGMGPIAEEASRPTRLSSESSRESMRDLLDLQTRYSDLSAKHAKMTAELAKVNGAGQPREGRSSLSPEDFALAGAWPRRCGLLTLTSVAVSPVVEEYEKSLSALESQLSLAKAALAHTDEALREADENLATERAANETASAELDQLRLRLAKLCEREASTETYVRDLETRLKSSTEGDEHHASVLTDMRKELARHREVEGNSERYIRDLEARLGKSDEALSALRQQVDGLEREVAQRDAAYRDLEARFALLDGSAEQKALVHELGQRDSQLVALQKSLDGAQEQAEAAASDVDRLQREADVHQVARANLEAELDALRQKSAAVINTPPHTPARDPDDDAAAVPPGDQVDGLHSRHERTLAELDSLTAQHCDARAQIDDLTRQLEEARNRRRSTRESLSPEVSPLYMPSLTHGDGPHSPSRSIPRSPTRYRRSAPIVANPSASRIVPFQRAPAASGPSPAGVAHSRSSSLSSEPSSVLGLRSFLPATTPRSVSPIPSLRDSVGGLHAERSYESLTKEVRQLQEALTAREAEITTLERSLSAVRSSVPSVGEDDTEELTIESDLSNGPSTPQLRRRPSMSTDLSPQTYAAFKELKAEFQVAAESDGDTEARIDDLMRSMAVKETAHKELVDELQGNLASVQRQHDALEALSRDQLINASSEINGLRQLHQDADGTLTALRAELAAVTSRLAEQQSDLVALQAKAANDLAVEQASAQERHTSWLADAAADRSKALNELQDRHHEQLRSVGDSASALAEAQAQVQRMGAEHEAHQAERDAEHARAMTQTRLDQEAALAGAAEAQAKSLDALRGERDEAFLKLEALAADHGAELDRLRTDHVAALDALHSDHRVQAEAARQALVDEHQRAIEQLHAGHAEAQARLECQRAELEEQLEVERKRVVELPPAIDVRCSQRLDTHMS
jgi:kinesin family protein 4/21/27